MWSLVLSSLENNHDSCETWANDGECDANPSFMRHHCAKACARVGYVQQEYDLRCPPPTVPPALAPGGLTALFERAVRGVSDLEPELVSRSPPIIVFDTFVTDDTADALLHQGQGRYQRSTGLTSSTDGTYESITTPLRTSSNAWCNARSCLEDPQVKLITERIVNVTGITEPNMEYAQLLHYHACGHGRTTIVPFTVCMAITLRRTNGGIKECES